MRGPSWLITLKAKRHNIKFIDLVERRKSAKRSAECEAIWYASGGVFVFISVCGRELPTNISE